VTLDAGLRIQASKRTAASPSTNPCCLGVEPYLDSWPDCEVQQTFAGFSALTLLAEEKRDQTCKVCSTYCEVVPLFSHDERIDSLHNDRESLVFCLSCLKGIMMCYTVVMTATSSTSVLIFLDTGSGAVPVWF
jgi:hypothetical protein